MPIGIFFDFCIFFLTKKYLYVFIVFNIKSLSSVLFSLNAKVTLKIVHYTLCRFMPSTILVTHVAARGSLAFSLFFVIVVAIVVVDYVHMIIFII